MTTQQEQQPEQLDTRGRKHRRNSRRSLIIITVLLLACVISVIWILSYLNVIPSFLAAIFTFIIAVLGAVFAFFQSIHLFIPADEYESHDNPTQARASLYIPSTPTPSPKMPPIIVQVPTSQPLSSPSTPLDKASYRGIVGLPPPTDPKTIEQRVEVVKEIYAKLIQPDMTAVALTGIAGVGKSTLAALVYRFAEEQRRAGNGPFVAEALWLKVDAAVTMVDLAGTLLEAIGQRLPDFGRLAPHNQAAALFNALDTANKPRLVILDQFEKLLDVATEHTLSSRPGVGEWIDALNSRPCNCRILLTSPWIRGADEYPPTRIQEYLVKGLEVSEGIELLRKQGAETTQSTEKELSTAVAYCAGHALSLTLLASILRRNRSLSLKDLFNDPIYAQLWTGFIARKLLDYIYTQQLDEVQRKLLLAFSVYREPISLDAAQMLISEIPKAMILPAFEVLLTQHLLQAVGKSRYQLHPIVASYSQSRFKEPDEEANLQTLKIMHIRATQYYLHMEESHFPPRELRKQISDVYPLIEAIWHQCHAEQWQEAFDLMEQERIFADLNRWGGNATLLELCQLLLPLDKWDPERLQAVHIYNNLGEIYRMLGQKVRARENFEEALRILREVGDRRKEGIVLNNLCRIYNMLGQKTPALQYGEEALSILREGADRREEGMALNNLSRIYADLGEKERALDYLNQALDILREVGDRGGEGWTLYRLGRIYSTLGEQEQALDYLKQALDLLREVGDLGREGWTLNNLGKVYTTLGEQDRAKEYYEEALNILRKVGNRRGEGRVLNNLGELYDGLAQKERALWYYDQALKIYREVGDRGGEGWTLNNIGIINANQGKKEEALKLYKEALKTYREVGDRGEEGWTLNNISIMYFRQGSHDIALAFFLLARKAFEEVQSANHEATQKWLEEIRNGIGEDQFVALLAHVDYRALEIAEQVLSEGL